MKKYIILSLAVCFLFVGVAYADAAGVYSKSQVLKIITEYMSQPRE